MSKERKEKLKDALTRIFREKGLAVNVVADQLGIPPESFRVTLSRNRFPLRYLSELAQIAGLPQDVASLKDKFEFVLTSRQVNKPRFPIPSNLMPLIKAISESGVETLSREQFEYLVSLQA